MSRARALPMPVPLPPDVRLMNRVSWLLSLVFAAMVLTLGVAWLMRQPLFNLGAISVQGEVTHNNVATLRANVAPRLAGNFFTVDMAQTRAVFESLPWVRRAVVQRQFPDRLRVVLQEHRPIARWGAEGDSRLVNNFGEVFEVNQAEAEAEDLPQLNGPLGQAALVLQVYQNLFPLFDKLDSVLEKLELTSQGGWRARLDSGAVLDLGHGSLDDIEARTQRFLATLPQVSSRFGRDLESADLRYGNGYAVKLRGVTTVNPADNKDRQAKR